MLISSTTLLVIGVGAASYLVKSGREAKEWADLASSTTTPAILMVQAFEEERRLSVLHLAGDAEAEREMPAARKKSDEALAAVIAKGDAARKLNPDGSASDIEGYNKLFALVPQLRNGVDARLAPPEQVFATFTSIIETIVGASLLAARVAPDADVAIELAYGVEPLRAAEALSKADTLGALALIVGELSPAQLTEFDRYVGEFRGAVTYSGGVLKGARLAQLKSITDSPAWQQVTAMQDAIMQRGPVSAEDSTRARPGTRAPELPIGVADWQNASGQVNSALLRLWEDQSRDAHVIAREQGDDTAARSLAGGAAVLLIAVLAFVAALVLANRFIGRMRRLRSDTLSLADEQLPDIMRRLEAGEAVDTTAEVPRLDFGTDELGQVAEAFNRAHVAAVSAAVAEATTRAGVNTVFLNIAHRSQVAVHRQLALLDQAERREENPDQLELLFQLDHLATRARRNAENLIILGGEQPGRRWRKPVPLLEMIRSAVGESLDYTRIQTGRVPEVHIAGKAVADLIHLMAELMDNATAFSPPQARVEVTATTVGRGVAVEIVDQGLGMSAEEIAERNRMLAEPPDFSVAALTGDTRLGLFVVAKLATRHGISIRLGESVYGGIRAVVLIPTALTESAGPDAVEAAEPATGEYAALAGTRYSTAEPATANGGGAESAAATQSSWFEPAGRTGVAVAPPEQPRAAMTGPPPTRPAQPTTRSQPPAPTRPPLPRRRRQATAVEDEQAMPVVEPPRQRTATEARNLMSAIEGGTRRGRHTRPDTDTTEQSRGDGNDDHFPAH
ncbi:sensor histidine kinase [Nocardia blacklockiae]|uniref:sensor histidine kinase n=1 Tax=Nocardia blacklockiae TaxID=480036 RepID=UPI002B4AF570|nr:nitrate- and nitrite sensing domain-containing protein [Nocardia blacklockiae]